MLGARDRPWPVPVPCDELAYVGLELQVEVVLNDVRPHTIHENRSLRRNRRGHLSEADQVVLKPRNVLLVQVRSEHPADNPFVHSTSMSRILKYNSHVR